MRSERCLCGVDVHKGALIAGCFVLVCSAVNLMTSIETMIGAWISNLLDPARLLGYREAQTNAYSTWWRQVQDIATIIHFVVMGFFAVNLLFSALMIIGNRKAKHQLYLPYTIWNALMLGATSVVGVIVFLAVILWTSGLVRNNLGHYVRIGVALVILIPLLISGVCWILYFYFFFIVVERSRRLLMLPGQPVDVVVAEQPADPRGAKRPPSGSIHKQPIASAPLI
ncbi:hypothetical protein M3Y99_00636400 [Aphelenchoides fujianensis]|nr:hypothetical protein M3Y99_00636400 [Aphelenchoides fujianensis]